MRNTLAALKRLENSEVSHHAPLTEPADLATALLGEPCEAAMPASGRLGGRVFRVRFASGRICALKRFSTSRPDPFHRVNREWAALKLLRGDGLRQVPRPIAFDPAGGALLLHWIEGTPVRHPRKADLDNLAKFIRRLKSCAGGLKPDAMPAAVEACLAPAQATALVHRRLDQLTKGSPDPLLQAFLDGMFRPALKRIEEDHRRNGEKACADPAVPLAPHLCTLSPADLGFHNALRTGNGLVFLDFEHFGWDDPVKLVADLMLHPRAGLPETLWPRFLEQVTDIFDDDPDFHPRLERSLPLFGAVWALNLLGEFLTRQRDTSADGEAEAQQRIERARAMLERGRTVRLS